MVDTHAPESRIPGPRLRGAHACVGFPGRTAGVTFSVGLLGDEHMIDVSPLCATARPGPVGDTSPIGLKTMVD